MCTRNIANKLGILKGFRKERARQVAAHRAEPYMLIG